MHELSIATAIVEQAEAVARRHGGAVQAVRVRVGEMAGVVPEALRFSFDVAREGTALSGARLVVETVPARAHCDRCDAPFSVAAPPFLCCPDCEEPAGRLLSGRELEITGVELEEVCE